MEFPWRIYDEYELLENMEDLKLHVSRYIPNSKITRRICGYKCSNAFFQYERYKCKRGDKNITGYEYWFAYYDKVFEHCNNPNFKHKDYFGIISYFQRVPSQFSPYISACIYKNFNAKKVLDPYAGWGDRAVGAMALDIEYIGIDSNPKLQKCYNNMFKLFTNKCTFINEKSEYIISELVDEYKPDLVFTSPPFWDESDIMIECYNNADSDYKSFLNLSLFPLVELCIERKIPLCMYVNNKMNDDICREFDITSTRINTTKYDFIGNKRSLSDIYRYVY